MSMANNGPTWPHCLEARPRARGHARQLVCALVAHAAAAAAATLFGHKSNKSRFVSILNAAVGDQFNLCDNNTLESVAKLPATFVSTLATHERSLRPSTFACPKQLIFLLVELVNGQWRSKVAT